MKNISSTLKTLSSQLLQAQDFTVTVKKYTESGAWGLCTSIDLYDCNLEKMKDEDSIRAFVKEVLKEIGMIPVGELQLRHFGAKKQIGYSFAQFIETSLLSGHFAETPKSIYLDIFSCKEYNPQQLIDYAKKHFEAKSVSARITIRP